jgi:hypothetical protein
VNPRHDNRSTWLRAALHCVLAACAVILAAQQLAHVGTP